MKTTVRGSLLLWTSGLAATLLACADSPPSRTAREDGVAVPMASGGSTSAARLWRGGSVAAAPAATPTASALALVERLAPSWGAPRGTAALEPLAAVAVDGGDLVRLRQVVDGVQVDGGELRILVGRGGALLAASGSVVPADIVRDRDGFVVDAATAVARAVRDLRGVDVTPGLRARAAKVGSDGAWFDGQVADVTLEEARARQRWHRDGDALIAAWVVESYTSSDDSTDTIAYRTVIAARDGRVLARRELTVDAFNYRVWADPTSKHPFDGPVADFSPHPTGNPGAGRPAFTAPALVSVEGLNAPADPWLVATATETVGNNVDAYTDINAPGGLTAGDFRASVTSPGSFDRVYDTSASPLVSNAQQQAAITQLFYSINWLHDDWYDAGFTEATGNGQADNFGRGGFDEDALIAEAQDGANAGNRNNANMSTPEDGMAPRMQVYVWSGEEEESITSQPGNRNAPANGPAAYGPANFDLTGVLIAGVDGTGASVTDGCETLTNAAAVAGKIALVERGNCTGKRKAANAQAAGAIGVIIAHNVAGSPAPGLPNDPAVTTAITIPVVSVGFSDGATLRSDLGNGPVTVTMHRRVGAEADGGLDAGLVAHEFGHYVHHRLSQCGTRMCGAMSEGWADFIALLTIARDGDDLAGAYGTAAYAWNGDPYFGIRRVPYSTNMQKNALTFRHVTEGEPLPTNHPVAFGGSNSEVHNAGEVWSSALWEAYVGLQQARAGASFDDTRRKMQRYVVNGLLMTPTDATFTETRDAILAAAQAASPADHDVLAAGFARRGLGSCALSPDRDSADFFGAVESFDVKGHAFPGETTLVVDVTNCDSDDALDVGETATITVPIVNSGAQDLAGVTVSVATTTAGLTVITAPVVVGALASYASATASFQVRLDAVTGPAAGVLDVTIASPGGCTETQVVNVPIRLAADDTLLASANDAFDAATSPWTATGDGGNLAWRHASLTALDRYWRGADMGTVSDTQLVSPALIAGTGAVTVSFDHTYQFEFSDAFYDGGVIEISTDGGATWADVATMVDVPYNATLGTESGNPLGGAEAFGDTNPSFPASDRVTLDFGTQLSGRTFQLRFRIGTDQAIGGPGWAIDHVQTTGLTNTPFPTQGADVGACGEIVEPPGEEDGGCCSTGGGPGPVAPIGLGVVAAAILARRRRREA